MSSSAEGTENGLAFCGNCAPFVGKSQQIRASIGGTLIKDVRYADLGIISTKLTDTNPYYKLSWGGGKLAFSLSRNQITVKGGNLKYTLPSSSVLANCVGGARGRYMELNLGNAKTMPPQGNPPAMWSTKPFIHLLQHAHQPGYVPPGGGGTIYKDPTSGMVFWKDTSGSYGPKDGLWGIGRPAPVIYSDWGGKYPTQAINCLINSPPIPGCFITWWKNDSHGSGHIEFVEGIFNYGKEDEYIITTGSSYGHFYLGQIGILNCMKRKKFGSYGSRKFDKVHNQYGFSYNYGNTTFLYTPLCDYQNMPTYRPAPDPTDTSLVDDYIKLLQEKLNPPATAGVKVQIEGIGNEHPSGLGKKVNRLLGQGWIKKEYDAGLPYPFEVIDAAKSTIGFFARKDLKVLPDK